MGPFGDDKLAEAGRGQIPRLEELVTWEEGPV